MIDSKIPIKNIYYMLSYAYKGLNINKTVLRESVEFDNVHNLFARILVNVINSLIKRGFYKDYILINEDTRVPKGKMNISQSIKKQTLLDKKLICQFDEFSKDVLFNRIIKTTIGNLLRSKHLNKDNKKSLKRLKPFFDNVSTVDLNKNIFKKLIWNNNNKYYNVAISICELIYLFKLPDESLDGNVAFKEFIQDKENELARLFENFVLNFYKKNCPKLKVHAPHIDWNLDYSFDNIGDSFLPRMRTDIVLENDFQSIDY